MPPAHGELLVAFTMVWMVRVRVLPTASIGLLASATETSFTSRLYVPPGSVPAYGDGAAIVWDATVLFNTIHGLYCVAEHGAGVQVGSALVQLSKVAGFAFQASRSSRMPRSIPAWATS